MRRSEIKTGVLYAVRRTLYDEPASVVFLSPDMHRRTREARAAVVRARPRLHQPEVRTARSQRRRRLPR